MTQTGIKGIFHYDPRHSLCNCSYLTALKTLVSMDKAVRLPYLAIIAYPIRFLFVPWFPGSSVLNLVLNCRHSHTIQCSHLSFRSEKRALFPVCCSVDSTHSQFQDQILHTWSLEKIWKPQNDVKQPEKQSQMDSDLFKTWLLGVYIWLNG